MTTWQTEFIVIPERPGRGRLGRHIKRDSRALAYPYRHTGAAIKSVTWARHIPILDQGDVGSCCGNATTGALGTDPFYDALPKGMPSLNEQLALHIYSQGETIDGDGPYPPQDNGSTGPSVAQAAKNDGYVSGYTHVTASAGGEEGILDALQAGPVLLGVNWYSSFDEPSKEGIVALPKTAYVRGGHEFVSGELDADRNLVWCDNSWGLSYGVRGRFAIPYSILARLLKEDGDGTVMVPLTAPAPVPVPTPGPGDVHVDTADTALYQALPAGWLTGHHTGGNERAVHAVTAWEQAKGLTVR